MIVKEMKNLISDLPDDFKISVRFYNEPKNPFEYKRLEVNGGDTGWSDKVLFLDAKTPEKCPNLEPCGSEKP